MKTAVASVAVERRPLSTVLQRESCTMRRWPADVDGRMNPQLRDLFPEADETPQAAISHDLLFL